MKKWFRVKARNTDIYKPNGKVIRFYISGVDESDVRKIIIKKGYTDIEYIREDNNWIE